MEKRKAVAYRTDSPEARTAVRLAVPPRCAQCSIDMSLQKAEPCFRTASALIQTFKCRTCGLADRLMVIVNARGVSVTLPS